MYYTSDPESHAASKDETYAQRQSSAGPTSSMVGQHWTGTAPMSRVYRDVDRKVWLYNLEYNRVVGLKNPLFSRSDIHRIAHTVGFFGYNFQSTIT